MPSDRTERGAALEDRPRGQPELDDGALNFMIYGLGKREEENITDKVNTSSGKTASTICCQGRRTWWEQT